MPLFEYKCRDCGKEFEELVQPGATPKCPACESAALTKLFSTFSAKSGSGGRQSPAPAPGGG